MRSIYSYSSKCHFGLGFSDVYGIRESHLIIALDKEPHVQRIEPSKSCPLGGKMVLELLHKESWLFIIKKG